MQCPACGHEITIGLAVCDGCHTDLTYLDDPLSSSGLRRKILDDPISSLKPATAFVIPEKEVLAYCIRFLQNHKIGCLVVVNEEGKVSGIITERDLLFKVAGTNADIDLSPVEAVMTRTPECLSLTDSIDYALHKMGHGGYRHIPLVDHEGRPTGILSVKDIMKYIVSSWDLDISEAV